MPKATVTSGEGFRVEASTATHRVVLDESREGGGTGAGITPQEAFAAALASCAAITMKMYAQRKGWALKGVSVTTTVERGATAAEPNRVVQTITLDGDLDAEQRERLREIAGKCPVHRFVAGPTTMEERLA
jgi:putative redox protein